MTNYRALVTVLLADVAFILAAPHIGITGIGVFIGVVVIGVVLSFCGVNIINRSGRR